MLGRVVLGTIGVLALAFARAPAPQGAEPAAAWPQGEGPLANDVFLPVSERAAAALAEGDLALAGNAGDPTAALESWRRALAESEAGDSVGSPRGTEAVERAVGRRLLAAGAEIAKAWRDRFDGAARSALEDAAWEPSALARVERGYPMTRDAARAAIALSDVAHEGGDPLASSAWLERARAHADPEDREMASAIERRRAAVRSARRPGADDPASSAWRAAARLEIEARVEFPFSNPPLKGVRPGVVLLRDGRACVQGTDTLHVVDPSRPRSKVKSLALSAVGREHGWSWLTPFASEEERWLIQPASDGERLAIVAGRAARTRGNALLFLEAGPGHEAAHLGWGYSDGGFHGDVAGGRAIEDVLGPGLWEFQPGPAILGGTVYAQARQWKAGKEEAPSVDEGSVIAWCLALDAETGLPRWKSRLAIGPSAMVRPWGSRGVARPADPLALSAGALFAGTGIGAGVLLDRGDGHAYWSLTIRRAPDGARRWMHGAPIPGEAAIEEEGATILWAPSDSDRLYSLRADPGTTSLEPFAGTPREIGDHREVIGAGPGGVLFLSRVGERATLSSVSLTSGARSDSAPLRRGESFSGGALVIAERAIVASDRAVYLFDLARDLRLLDAVELPGAREDPAGSIAARGNRVYVAGERTLWILGGRAPGPR